MRLPVKIDGEIVCMLFLGLLIAGAGVAAIIEDAQKRERFEICPLCEQQIPKAK